MDVLAVLLGVMALLFGLDRFERTKGLFRVVPLLVFAYFVPTALSNTGLIPVDEDFELYVFIKQWLLPTSLVLLVLSVDVKAILGLGRTAVSMFLIATLSIVLGGPFAFGLLKSLVPPELGDEAWKGLAALSGSWIGGGANFVAIGETVDASADTMSLMVVVDVAVANVWTAVLLLFAGREKRMDAKIGADRRSLDAVRSKVEAFQRENARPTSLPDLLLMAAIAFGTTAAARAIAPFLPTGEIMNPFIWTVVLATTVALLLSFTRVRRLEGAGASALGSVFLYLLVGTIGAKAQFARIFDPDNFGLLAIAALWMLFHIGVMLLARRLLRAPVFFLAVGSQANIGGAASAPVVASAFHPALAPVGVLLAVAGYLLGVYAGVVVIWLMKLVA
ncbi:MAG: DUF819 family protein [Planctomycetes bacterium]|nr:DUF819 family protein [Planctomycetota bacterium]